MSNKKLDQIWLVTKPGAFTQALDLAAQSDRLADEDNKPGSRKQAPQDRAAMVWRLLPWALWVLAMALYAIALDL